MGWLFDLILLAAGTALVLAIINWDEIKSWFQARSSRIDNYNTVARTVVDAMSNGNYRIQYGIFNKRDASFIEQETKETKSLDSELRRKHAGSRIVDYVI